MRSKRQKISGFTLNEVLITMVVGSIVVGLAYTAITLISKNMATIQENFNEKDKTILLEQRMTLDFETYPTITYDSFEDELKLSSPLDSVLYTFSGDHILRNTDTIKISYREKGFFFLGEEKSNGPIDAISLTLEDSLKTKKIFISKVNDALTKLKNGN